MLLKTFVVRKEGGKKGIWKEGRKEGRMQGRRERRGEEKLRWIKVRKKRRVCRGDGVRET